MNAKSYHRTHGGEVCKRIATRAGTNWAYFKQMVYGVRKPSAKLARKLVSTSKRATPEKPLSLEGLLFPPQMLRKNGKEARIRA